MPLMTIRVGLTVIVSFTPGGSTDIMARTMRKSCNARWVKGSWSRTDLAPAAK
jgi:tripartite-type tricarboxylate transporter receptor subunit TctC